MVNDYFKTAALAGALAVALGAFGSHGLKKIAQPDVVNIFETGVKYQFYHVFALLAVAYMLTVMPSSATLQWSGRFFVLGIVLFSGSLYGLTVAKIYQLPITKFLGPITPIGGVCFIAGWLCMFFALWGNNK